MSRGLSGSDDRNLRVTISTWVLTKIVEPKKRSLQLRTITLHAKIHRTFSLPSFRYGTCDLYNCGA